MVSENETAAPKNRTETTPPAYNHTGDEEGIPIRDGLYILTNKMSRTVLDLCNSRAGTPCHGHSHNRTGGVGNQIWIVQQSSAGDTYTLKNIQHAAALDFNPDIGPHPTGYCWNEGSPHQAWRIVEHAPHYYTLQGVATSKYLEIPGGNPANCINATCSDATPESQRNHQLWSLDRVGRSGLEVRALIEQWKPDLSPRLLLPHGETAEYLCLPGTHYRSIWERTNLQLQPVRRHLSDYDLFVIKSKDEVQTWARDTFPAEILGFGVLFGIVYGEAKKGPKAYNWYLMTDMCSLVFFDPQTGKEYSAAALNAFGFEPTFAML